VYVFAVRPFALQPVCKILTYTLINTVLAAFTISSARGRVHPVRIPRMRRVSLALDVVQARPTTMPAQTGAFGTMTAAAQKDLGSSALAKIIRA